MTGVSYAPSAEMASQQGPFPGFKKNREHMLRVIRNHRRAAYGENTGYEKLATAPVRLDHATLANNAVFFKGLSEHSKRAWDRALTLGEEHGHRNAQAPGGAPARPLGLGLDCRTT